MQWELCLKPRLVGREEELRQLESYLDNAMKGHGSAVFISGEAGIGKTRLVEELKQIAGSKGFQMLSGCSLFESLTPYMPFYEALKSGGLEHLFADEAPRVEAAYLVTQGGLLTKHVVRKETKLNPDIFSSMLITIGDFAKESLSMFSGRGGRSGLNILGFEDHRILIEAGRSANLVVIIAGKENEFLIDEMRNALLEVDKSYGNELVGWDGDEDKVEGIERLLDPFLTSGKYDGIYYGKDNAKARRNLLFENVSLGLKRQSEEKPLVLCIEDLQWTDPSTLALIHYVARNTKECGLLILGTYRPEEVAAKEHHPLAGVMQLMEKEDLRNEMCIGRLPKETLLDFLRSMLTDCDFDDQFISRVYAETEGNPLFIVQLVKNLAEEGIIVKRDGVWRLSEPLDKVEIPSKVYTVILQRLNRVGNKDRRVLDYASVNGEMFTSDVLVVALNARRDEVLERLRDLERVHQLIRTSNEAFKFDHIKIKEVLYNEIPQELRREYHCIIANSIERMNSENLGPVICDLAFHYHCARKSGKALEYLMKAAERAKREYSNDEAVRFYAEALEFEEDGKKRMEMLVAMGDVYTLIGEYDKVIESYDKALEYAEGDRTKAGIKAKIGDIYQLKGEYVASLRASNEALELVKGMGCEEEAESLNTIGSVHSFRGDRDRALEFLGKSLGISEKIGDQRRIAGSLNNIGFIHRGRGDYDRALEFLGKGLSICEKIGDQHGVANSLNNIGIVHCNRGDYDRAPEVFGKSLSIHEKIGDQRGIANNLGNIGIVHARRGDCDRALEFCGKSLSICEKIGNQRGIAINLNNIGNVHCWRMDCDRALEFFGKSLSICEKIGDKRGIEEALCNIGIVHTERGDGDRALEFFGKELETAKRMGHKLSMAESYLGMSRIDIDRGNLKKAEESCNQAYVFYTELGLKVSIAESQRVLGKIRCEQKDWEGSIENFEKGIAALEKMGAGFELAESYLEFGLMWAKKGDSERARDYLKKAVDAYEGMKLDRRAEKARAALKQMQT